MRSLIKTISLIFLAMALILLGIATRTTGSTHRLLMILAAALGIGGLVDFVLFILYPGIFRDRAEKYRDGQ